VEVKVMRKNILIFGIILSFIAVFAIYIGLIRESTIGALGVILIIMGIPMILIVLFLKSNEVPSIRRCPKCNREIPFDAKVCSHCQNVLTDVLRHEY
jgi:hypothetical protein